MSNVFIAGATGYMGSRLAVELLRRGHAVFGLVGPGSEKRLPNGCRPIPGNALDRSSFVSKIAGTHTYVQLVGVAHPSPSKAELFWQIDQKSCEESGAAALANKVRHFVYVSVAHPAPVMTEYVEVCERCEEMIRTSGQNATILRQWGAGAIERQYDVYPHWCRDRRALAAVYVRASGTSITRIPMGRGMSLGPGITGRIS